MRSPAVLEAYLDNMCTAGEGSRYQCASREFQISAKLFSYVGQRGYMLCQIEQIFPGQGSHSNGWLNRQRHALSRRLERYEAKYRTSVSLGG